MLGPHACDSAVTDIDTGRGFTRIVAVAELYSITLSICISAYEITTCVYYRQVYDIHTRYMCVHTVQYNMK